MTGRQGRFGVSAVLGGPGELTHGAAKYGVWPTAVGADMTIVPTCESASISDCSCSRPVVVLGWMPSLAQSVAVGLGAGSIGALAATTASLVWGDSDCGGTPHSNGPRKVVRAPGNGPGRASESLSIEVGICRRPI